jgi:hypothetical protein
MDDLKRRKDDHWHIGKTLDAGHLLTTVLMIVGVTLYFGNMDKRIAVLEDRQMIQEEMRQDLKEIKMAIAALPDFVERKDETDRDQWRAIREMRDD